MKSCICCSEVMYYWIWQNIKLFQVGHAIAHTVICVTYPSFCRLKGTFTGRFTIYDVIIRCEVVSLLFLTLFTRYQLSNLPALVLQKCALFTVGCVYVFVSSTAGIAWNERKSGEYPVKRAFLPPNNSKRTIVKSKLSHPLAIRELLRTSMSRF